MTNLFRIFALALTWCALGLSVCVSAQTLPKKIYLANTDKSSHVQGIAVDAERGFVYFSFTTSLLKTDMQGNVLASLTGLTCHLGCLDLDRETGKLYASIEYKDDGIGKGLLKTIGKDASSAENTFYIGIFDVDKLTRLDMNAETSGVMRTVFLPEVVACYEDTVMHNGKRRAHRFGCSGIDGIAVGPAFGSKKGERRLYVDMALYGDNDRTDNDYQILLEYDLAKLERYACPLDQSKPHHIGPKHADRWYYAFTGNTAYGVQNLEYDEDSKLWFMAVYKGKKPQYPNYTLFAIDGTKPATKQILKGFDKPKRGRVLTLAEVGARDAATGIRGWVQNVGATGIESMGKGLFYLSFPGRTADGMQTSELRLHRYVGRADCAFEEVK